MTLVSAFGIPLVGISHKSSSRVGAADGAVDAGAADGEVEGAALDGAVDGAAVGAAVGGDTGL